MGAKIVFFTSINEKSLKDIFLGDYQKFKDWTLSDWNTSELKDNGELSMGQKIALKAVRYLNENKNVESEIASEIIDELITVYFCSYCDHGKGKEQFELRGPMMNKWRYEKSTKLVNQKCDKSIVQLWNRLVFGCSTNSQINFSQSLSNDIVLGWWNVEEMKNMKDGLSKSFKDIQEFNEWKNTRRNGVYTARKEYEGLEYVFDVLDIGINENKEVIFYNENE